MDIARALGGLGAAFKNEVPQFREQVRIEDLDAEKRAQREMLTADRIFDRGIAAESRARTASDRDRRIRFEDEDRAAKKDEQRQKTLFVDNRVALDLFKTGDYGSIEDLFNDRVSLLPDGVNNQDSVRMRRLAAEAPNSQEAVDALGQELRRIDSFAVINEVLSAPEDRDVFKDMNGVARYNDGTRVPLDRSPMTVAGESQDPLNRDMSILDQRAEEQSRLDRTIPPSLLRDLSPSMQAEAQEVWSSLGGGSASMTAYNALLKTDRERGRRGSLDQTLSTVFPSATNDELGH